jgi:hypothetical protein
MLILTLQKNFQPDQDSNRGWLERRDVMTPEKDSNRGWLERRDVMTPEHCPNSRLTVKQQRIYTNSQITFSFCWIWFNTYYNKCLADWVLNWIWIMCKQNWFINKSEIFRDQLQFEERKLNCANKEIRYSGRLLSNQITIKMKQTCWGEVDVSWSGL